MAFFKSSRKKNERLNSLSEEDIQAKLYGKFQSKDLSSPKPLKESSQIKYRIAENQDAQSSVQPVENNSVYSAAVEDSSKTYRPGNEDLFTQSQKPYEHSQNSSASDQGKNQSVSGYDSKDQSSWTEPKKPEAEADVPSYEQRLEQERMKRLEKIAEQEKKIKKKYEQQARKPVPVPKKKKTAPVKPKVDYGKHAAAVFKAVGAILVSGLLWVAGVLGSLIRLMDFRRPKVRRFFLWVGVIALLAALFYGIHLLNVKREKAMKMARTNAAAIETTKETQAEQSASEEASESQGGQNENAEADGPLKAPVSGDDTSDESAAQQQPPAEPEKTAADYPYVIQVATYINNPDAQRLKNALSDAGLDAFVKNLTRPSGKIYYSVFVGRYENFKEAQKSFEEFKKNDAARPFRDAFIRSLS